jgi:hypothetical protein
LGRWQWLTPKVTRLPISVVWLGLEVLFLLICSNRGEKL